MSQNEIGKVIYMANWIEATSTDMRHKLLRAVYWDGYWKIHMAAVVIRTHNTNTIDDAVNDAVNAPVNGMVHVALRTLIKEAAHAD